MSASIGTTATPARRSGLWLHSSASQRLWARAPAMARPGSRSPDCPRPGAERSPGDPGDGVGVGEDDLAGHPVAVELFVALGDIPSAGDAVAMLVEPRLRELLVDEAAGLRRGNLLGQVGLEVLPVFGVDVFAVLLGRQLGVGVCGDDEVGVASFM